MSYSKSVNFTMYTAEQVQKELGIFDLYSWTKLLAGYDFNPRMVEYEGFFGMDEDEKNRLVNELKQKLATMPELLERTQAPAHRRPNGYKRVFTRIISVYTMEDCIAELNIGDKDILGKVLDGYQANPDLITINGRTGFLEPEKRRIVAELLERRDQYLEKLRGIDLDILARNAGRIMLGFAQ